MAAVSKTYTFSAGAVIIAAQHNTDFDTLYNLVNGTLDGTNLAANAAIADTQLGQITTAGKVSGAALTSLASIPSGAGVIPAANLPAASTGGGVLGSYKNLKIVYASLTTVTLTADEIILEDGSNVKRTVRSLNGTISSATSGAVNKLDTGSIANDTIYYIWAISNGTTDGGLISISSTNPTMPATYTYKTLVGAVGANHTATTSGGFISFTQNGRDCYFTNWAVLASGIAGLTPWVAIELTPANMTTVPGFVPLAISTHAFGSFTANTSSTAGVTNDGTVTATRTIQPNKFLETATATGPTTAAWNFNLLGAHNTSLYWLSDDASANVYIHGYRNNLL